MLGAAMAVLPGDVMAYRRRLKALGHLEKPLADEGRT
jgi:hypothetical protein